jgi:hypothetical protein
MLKNSSILSFKLLLLRRENASKNSAQFKNPVLSLSQVMKILVKNLGFPGESSLRFVSKVSISIPIGA